ncbi:hypothetical protein BWQ96_06868 [Gracilariopsis chorda]|uniref:Uncharacterized protein n=1 Tax=Gracilariopsis chorda TaxID=448386 RepID=A0A2V3IMS2_9FLOR|nr:hypothetical protein BWQ96_06868 [Gracilariopsis chorda]|eukprot:PXF43373.1 hypothetical protein BWQ96_06868 [Gracilariopsis chorda]
MLRFNRNVYLLSLSWFALMFKSYAATVLISQAFKGRAFGSLSSNDVAKRISVGNDGSLYLAGITTTHDEEHDAWGDAEPGELTGKADIFVAKLSASGNLEWVKRTGSTEDDSLSDMKLANNAIYLCGSTKGNFGSPVNGSTDAFVMKFSLDGEKLWSKPFQFGSKGEDACNAVDVDTSGVVYAVGSTNGLMYGALPPKPYNFHHFIVKLKEVPGSPSGLQTILGRQRGTHGNSSADQIAVVDDLLYVMTSSASRQTSHGEAFTTYLNLVDREAMFLHKLHMLKSHHGVNFQGVRMATTNSSKSAYVVGFTTKDDMRKQYTVLKFNSSLSYGQGGVEWGTLLGPVSSHFEMLRFETNNPKHLADSIAMTHQLPSVIANEEAGSVYVAGTEDGYYKNNNAEDQGLLVVPFFKLNATNGEVVERWHRSTTVPHDRQELTDIALDKLKTVVYTGAWWVGSESKSSVLLGSFGSTVRTSTADEWNTRPSYLQDSGAGTSKASKPRSSAKTIGLIVLAIAGVGIVSTVIVLAGLRSYRLKSSPSDDESSDSRENLRITTLRSHMNVRFPPSPESVGIVGGSSGPQ